MRPADPTDLQDWHRLENDLCVDRYTGHHPPGTVTTIDGTLPVLLTAPHAVAHLRTGIRKGADVATAGLALISGRRAGAPTLIATGFQEHDGNHSPTGPFKDAARAWYPHVQAAVDIHGMTDGLPGQICLGTGAHPPPNNVLLEAALYLFTRAGFTTAIDDPYGAKHPHSLTSTAQRAGLPALQVEVARSLRRPFDDPTTALAVADALAELVGIAASLSR